MPPLNARLTRRSLIGAGAALLTINPMVLIAQHWIMPRQAGAGFCQRLLYNSLANDLRAGRMTTVLNGTIVRPARARRMVARARAEGW